MTRVSKTGKSGMSSRVSGYIAILLAPLAAAIVFLLLGELYLIVTQGREYGEKYTVSLTEFRTSDRALVVY